MLGNVSKVWNWTKLGELTRKKGHLELSHTRAKKLEIKKIKPILSVLKVDIVICNIAGLVLDFQIFYYLIKRIPTWNILAWLWIFENSFQRKLGRSRIHQKCFAFWIEVKSFRMNLVLRMKLSVETYICIFLIDQPVSINKIIYIFTYFPFFTV